MAKKATISDDNKTESIRIRISKRDKRVFKKAAKLVGKNLSEWFRDLGVKAA
jgi:uncharacterized protein (DUF1778 family)